MKKYIVELTEDERRDLLAFVNKESESARRIARAQILLLADEDRPDEAIAEVLRVGRATVERIRKKYHQGGLRLALNDLPRPGKEPKLNPEQEALLVSLARSAPPDGCSSWTMQLLADKLVEMEVVDTISYETVRRSLKRRLGRG